MSRFASDIKSLFESLEGNEGPRGDMGEVMTALVFRKNRATAYRFLCTPRSQRTVLVPQCLRSTSACRAEERDSEYICKGCGACKIAEISRRARELGYIGVRVLKGGSALVRLIGQTRPKAVLGISCCMEGVMGILACERAGIPAFCVPLLRAGCSDTDVDMDDVRCVMETVLT